MNFFLTQDHMQLETANCYFCHKFHWTPSKLYMRTLVKNAKSNCLHLVPKITYSM